jgi:excisionase family DNA binding protein
MRGNTIWWEFMEDKFMTVDEVAKWLKIRAETVRIMIRENKLKAVRIGDGKRPRYRIAFANVLDYINRNQ